MKTVTLDEFERMLRAQGVPIEEVKFKCPRCGTIQSGRDLIEAGAGKDFDEIEKYAYRLDSGYDIISPSLYQVGVGNNGLLSFKDLGFCKRPATFSGHLSCTIFYLDHLFSSKNSSKDIQNDTKLDS